MRIAFDAKRAYQNTTGLGHYSRTLITSLAKGYPEHEYFLAAPVVTSLYDHSASPNMHDMVPGGISRYFPSLWRSKWVVKDLVKMKMDLYHGLSHEIPVGVADSGIRSVVTMHDLIFERYPGQYGKVDLEIYRKKSKYACNNADRIIAISEQTKQDIVSYYAIKPGKIDVCYQGCNPMFRETAGEAEKQQIRKKYGLPEKFFLYVGSIIERKNLLTVCKAINTLHRSEEWTIPLVVIGTGGRYLAKVKDYIAQKHLEKLVIFLSENESVSNDPGFTESTDFPAIYQLALAMVYPSIFEGFGIPILEALCSRLPVITSNKSCMPETGGDAALYISPQNDDEIAGAMKKVSEDEGLRMSMIEKGIVHAQKFTPEAAAASVMNVYRSVLKT